MLKPQARWLIVVLSVALAVIVAHAWIITAHTHRTSSLGRDDVRISLPYQLVRPEFTVDGHMWIRHSVNLTRGDGPQLRATQVDNAPHGREVHWNSAYAWWIALNGLVREKITGLPRTQATEQAAMWVNVPLIFGFTVLFAVWAWRRIGLAAGVALGLAMFGHRSLYEGFWPGYADHHGITLASILGLVLGAYLMRGGWVRRDDPDAECAAVSAARWSAFWGASALWISAASAIPAIAFVAAATSLATLLTRGTLAQTAAFSPAVWRAWGRTGALASAAFYLLEYFPFHLGWRLEVNHPLYALAWWAGAELTARLLPLLAGTAGRGGWPALLRTAAWALPCASLPLVVVALAKSRVFLPADPFMVGLHRTITEFLPLMWRVPIEGIRSHYDALIQMPALYALALLAMFVRGADRWALLFALATAVPLHAMGFYQSRWAMSAAPGQVLIVVALLGVLPLLRPLAGKTGRQVLAAALLLGLFYGPSLYFRTREAWTFATVRGITAGDGRQLVYREVAQVIRESQPEGEVVLFGSPNTSVNVGFYGDFKTLGTLYWENLAGLKAAAEISSARTDEEAARLLKERGVTHLAFFRDGNYILEFARLLHPGITDEEAVQTLGYRLLGGRMVPVWLEALPYAAPDGLPEGVDKEVLVFKVNFEQKPTEAAYRLGMLQMKRQELDDALQTFELALRLDQVNYPAALRRAEIHLQRAQWAESVESFNLAVRIAPPAERYRLLTQVGIAMSTAKRKDLAVDFYERALREEVINAIAPNNLAWILATSPDEALRQPARALQLAQGAVSMQPDNAAVIGTLAAAQAANGRFAAAVETLERAIELARAQNAADLLSGMELRLARYRAGELWFEAP